MVSPYPFLHDAFATLGHVSFATEADADGVENSAVFEEVERDVDNDENDDEHRDHDAHHGRSGQAQSKSGGRSSVCNEIDSLRVLSRYIASSRSFLHEAIPRLWTEIKPIEIYLMATEIETMGANCEQH